MENIITKAEKRATGEKKKLHGVASSGSCGGPLAKAGTAVALLGSRLVFICHGILPLPNHPCALPVLL